MTKQLCRNFKQEFHSTIPQTWYHHETMRNFSWWRTTPHTWLFNWIMWRVQFDFWKSRWKCHFCLVSLFFPNCCTIKINWFWLVINEPLCKYAVCTAIVTIYLISNLNSRMNYTNKKTKEVYHSLVLWFMTVIWFNVNFVIEQNHWQKICNAFLQNQIKGCGANLVWWCSRHWLCSSTLGFAIDGLVQAF